MGIQMPAKCFTALAVAFAMASCTQVFKPTVTKTETLDEGGQHVATYTNCDPTRVLAGKPRCYSEKHTDTYCYRTLGDVNCFERQPVGRDGSITEATEE